MVEPERNFTKKKMKSFSRHSTVWIEPMFCITPKAFDAVNVSSPLRSFCFLAHHDAVSSHGKRPIGMPVVGVVEAARLRVHADKTDDLAPFASLNRKHPDRAVTLEDAEYNDLACRSPASFARSTPAKRGLIAFYASVKGLSAFFLNSENGLYQAKKPLHGRPGSSNPEAHPVDRYAQDEKLKEPPLDSVRESTGIPNGSPGVSKAATTALKSSIGKVPCTAKITFRATSHDQNILLT